MNEPVIKWSGSKRSQAKSIVECMPQKIETYYEPFCGGASVLRELLNSEKEIKKMICSDLNSDLINLWNMIKNNHDDVKKYYKKLYEELNKDNDKNRKKEYFNEIRNRFNKEKNPLDFMFIMRTTTNGMPRYNKKGEFNNSFHITRNGIMPCRLDKILDEWNYLLNHKNVDFLCCSFDEVETEKNDFMYLDPPYYNTKGMYYGRIDYELFFEYLRKLKCKYIFSFDGISGDEDKIYNVPEDTYNEHKLLLSGKSSFKRIIGKSKDSVVYESLYIKK